MTPRVDYDFYVNVFLGRAVEPEEFPRLAARAGEYVDGLCRGRCGIVPEKDRELVRFAVCAVIELTQDEERLEKRALAEGKTSETVGSYSVSYGSFSGTEIQYLERKKREAAARYLAAVPALRNLFTVRSYPCMHHIR